MISAKSWQLSRRTMLKGTGAALALPWLNAMAGPAAQQLDRPPVRSAFLFMPNGVRPDHWTPPRQADGGFELMPHLRPLKGLKGAFSLLENLWNENSVGRNGHWPKVPAFLSGGFVVRTAGRDLDSGGTSIDQLIAKRLGGQTPLPSLELGVDSAYSGVDNVGGGFTRIYGSHIAWRDRYTPVPLEIIPRLAFDRLFRTGKANPIVSGIHPNQPAVTKSLQGDDRSVLDLVIDDARQLRRHVGSEDRTKIDEYLQSVRSVEQRIAAAMRPQRRWIKEGRFDVVRPGQGIPEDHQEHVRLMLDILVLAFWTDTTRVATMMFGNAQTGRNFSFIDGVRGSFHPLSHHRDEENERTQYEKIVDWHMVQVAYLLERMRSLDEGGMSLLDNSLVMFGSTLKDGNRHTEEDLPILLAGRGGGKLQQGRRLTAPTETPLCNLYLSWLNDLGIEVKEFGDSTGTFKGFV